MKRLLLTTLCLLVVPACSSDDPVGPIGATGGDLDAVLTAAGKVVPPEEERDDITKTEEVRDGARYISETHDAVEHLDSVVYLGLNDDVIWPGSMVRGDQAQSYTYVPISAPRAPITLSISLEGTGLTGSLSEEVADPTLSKVRQGISALVGRALDQEVSDESSEIGMKVSYLDMEGLPLDPSRLEQGTDFMAEVTLTHPGIRMEYKELALTQMFPSGWEIRNLRLDNMESSKVKNQPDYQDISKHQYDDRHDIVSIGCRHLGYLKERDHQRHVGYSEAGDPHEREGVREVA